MGFPKHLFVKTAEEPHVDDKRRLRLPFAWHEGQPGSLASAAVKVLRLRGPGVDVVLGAVVSSQRSRPGYDDLGLTRAWTILADAEQKVEVLLGSVKYSNHRTTVGVLYLVNLELERSEPRDEPVGKTKSRGGFAVDREVGDCRASTTGVWRTGYDEYGAPPCLDPLSVEAQVIEVISKVSHARYLAGLGLGSRVRTSRVIASPCRILPFAVSLQNEAEVALIVLA